MTRSSTISRLTLISMTLATAKIATADITTTEAPGSHVGPSTADDFRSDDVEVQSYRSTTMTADGVGMAVVGVGLTTLIVSSDGGVQRAGLGGMAIGTSLALAVTPIIHASRGHLGRAIASGGMRVGATLLGGIAGMYVGDATNNGDCETGFSISPCIGRILVGFVAGASLGFVVAATVDAVFLTDERVPRRPERAWTPQLSVSENGVHAGIGGAF